MVFGFAGFFACLFLVSCFLLLLLIIGVFVGGGGVFLIVFWTENIELFPFNINS